MSKRKKGRGRKGKVPPQLRRYLFKKKRRKGRKKGSRPMARKRRSTKRRRSGSRRRSGETRRRRRSSSGGSSFALMPPRSDLELWGAMGAYGWLERKAKADQTFLLNRVPEILPQAGFTGNVALVSWAASHWFRNKWLRLFARATAGITAYQLGRKGEPFNGVKDYFIVAGYDDDDVRQMVDNAVGALNPDGSGTPDGVSFDGAVAQGVW